MSRRPRRVRPGEGWEYALGELLSLTGWVWRHETPAYVPGRRAPLTTAKGPGAVAWPDFTAWRVAGHRGSGRFLVAEAKAGDSTLSAAQRARLEDLDNIGVEAYRFRERDLEAIRRVLVAPHPPALLLSPEDRAALQPWRVRRSSRRPVVAAGTMA